MRWWWLCAWVVLFWGAVFCWVPKAGAAQTTSSEVGDLRLERGEDGLYLSANLQFELPELAEDALQKGIPMFFVADAQVLRDRWYWSDRQVAETTRYFRLSYQPLTRRWRLSQSSAPFADNGLGVSLGQNFDELGEALAVMQRISRWSVADGDVLDNGTQTLHFQFRLDMSQLPRPLQLSTVGRSGWSLSLSRSVRLNSTTVETSK